MTDTFRTNIGRAGPTHSGQGAQHVYYGVRSPSWDPRPLATDQLEGLAAEFVEPTTYGQAGRALRERGTVLLRGEPGSGRTATARMLLHHNRRLFGTLREVLPETEEGKPGLGSYMLGEREGLLLDLTELGPAPWESVQRDLPTFHQSVRQRESRLVVVLPSGEAQRTTDPFLEGLAVEVPRADPAEVLDRALKLVGDPALPVRPVPAELHRFLEQVERLNDVALLAQSIGRHRTREPSRSAGEWCRSAVAALTRPPQVPEQMGAATARQKALLLSVAMLDGARPKSVDAVCEVLLRKAAHQEVSVPLLDRTDLSAQFEGIGAVLDADGRVRLKEPDRAQAVRRHFWDYTPWLKEKMQGWITEAVTGADLDAQERSALLVSLASELGRAQESGMPLWRIARRLADGPAPGLRETAKQAMGWGLTHPSWGRHFSQELYDWARSGDISEPLRGVLIEVCLGPLAARFPEQALVRLHHLARRLHPADTGVRALLSLIADNPRLYAFALHRLMDGMSRSHRERDTRLFLHLSTPEILLTGRAGGSPPLLHSRVVRTGLAKCWGELLSSGPPEEWTPPLRDWFTTIHQSPTGHAPLFLDLLTAACHGHPDAYGLLYRAARHHPIRPLLRTRLNEARALSF
ncbi:hypothetical protein ABZ929_18560 [Streptomyces physcomitrii]|uniref:hypothetical protein n=1 Tax=Streptomyces physcomitrii TaxID=2724184 RepID=UPI0033E73F57